MRLDVEDRTALTRYLCEHSVVTLDGQDMSEYVGLSTDSSDNLVVSLAAGQVSVVFCATDSSLYLTATINLSTSAGVRCSRLRCSSLVIRRGGAAFPFLTGQEP